MVVSMSLQIVFHKTVLNPRGIIHILKTVSVPIPLATENVRYSSELLDRTHYKLVYSQPCSQGFFSLDVELNVTKDIILK